MRAPDSSERWACGDNPELARRLRKTHIIECDHCHVRQAVTNSHTREGDEAAVLFLCADCWIDWHHAYKTATKAIVRAWMRGGQAHSWIPARFTDHE